MYKNFLKKYTILLFSIILFSACKGQNCIEANDFGEYDNDNLNIYTSNSACNWSDDGQSVAGPDDSEFMKGCLFGYGKIPSNTIIHSNNKCSVTIKSIANCTVVFEEDKNTNQCESSILRFCSLDTNSCSTISFSNQCLEAKQGDNVTSIGQSYVNEAFQIVADACKTLCTDENGYDPGWESNTIKEYEQKNTSFGNKIKTKLKNIFTNTNDSNIGIGLSNDSTVYIQASGSISLENSSGKEPFYFDPKKIYVRYKDNNEKYFLVKNPTSFSIDGSWCSKSSCGNDYYGNKSSVDASVEDIGKREQFLRRGVIVLKDLPNDFDESDPKNGVIPNFSKWSCTASTNKEDDYFYSCESNESISIDDGFSKVVGGEIIPTKNVEDIDIKEYLLYNPLEEGDIQLGNNGAYNISNSKYSCDVRSNAEGCTKLKDGIVKNLLIGQDGVQKWYAIYPSKIAFKVLSSQNNGNCTITLTTGGDGYGNNLTYVKEINKDDKWHLLLNNNQYVGPFASPASARVFYEGSTIGQSPLILNGNFDSLQINSNKDQNLNRKYSVDIEIAENGCVVQALMIPQNEIYVNKSGFASFIKNQMSGSLLKNNTSLKTPDVNFYIINPLYDYISKNCSASANTGNCKDVIESNFYEYGIDRSDNTNFESLSTVANYGEKTLSVVNSYNDVENNMGSRNTVFVRKGQILRFDDSLWNEYSGLEQKTGEINGKSTQGGIQNGTFVTDIVFTNINSKGDNSYTIKQGEDKQHNFNVVDGLIIVINERPALICSGIHDESLQQQQCSTITLKGKINKNDTEEVERTVCKLEPSDICKTEGDSYCPQGCFDPNGGDIAYADPYPDSTAKCDFGIKSFNSDNVYYDSYDDYKNGQVIVKGTDGKQSDNVNNRITTDTCNNCKNKINSEYLKNSGLVEIVGKSNNSDNQDVYSAKVEIIQCYDLENYSGAVSQLFDSGNKSESNNIYKTKNENDAKDYGYLTEIDYILGARKLGSIFSSSNYGNLDGMKLSTSGVSDSSDGNSYKDFSYNSPSDLGIDGKKMVGFFVIDNANFVFDTDPANDQTNFGGFGNYKDNSGDGDGYKFSFSPKVYYTNGDRMNVALGVAGFDSSCEGIDLDNSSGCELYLIKWLTKYKADGTLDENESPYEFSPNGTYKKRSDSSRGVKISDLNLPSEINLNCDKTYCDSDEPTVNVSIEDAKFFFKVADKKEKCSDERYGINEEAVEYCCSANGNNCDNGPWSSQYSDCTGEIKSRTVLKCNNDTGSGVFYSNNSGSYSVLLQAPKDSTSATSYIVKYVMDPIIQVLDGKTVGVAASITTGKYLTCESNDKKDCVSIANDGTFGKNCTTGDQCYYTCDAKASMFNKCVTVNDNSGFLQNFYKAVINDASYQIILRLCFILMVSFYGLYYLLGLVDMTHGELIKRVLKIGIIYLFVSKDGWYYYNMFFVKFFKDGVDYLVFAIAGAFDQNGSIEAMFAKYNFYDKSVLFSGVDKNLSLIFSDPVSNKIWGLFFVSFFGWLYVFIIYVAIFYYISAVANALLLYLTAQFFVSMLLSLGPIFFVLLVFDKTKEMFDKWINNLVSFSLEQIFLLTCLSLFNSLVYGIIKTVLSFRVCWTPVWVMNIPILGSIEMMKFWKATNATSVSAASSVPGLFQILLIYLIADIMKKFIGFATDLGNGLGGGGLSSSKLTKDIKKSASDFFDKSIKDKFTKWGKDKIATFANRTIGYKTEEEEKKDKERNKVLRKGLRGANRVAAKAKKEAQANPEIDALRLSGQTEKYNQALADAQKKAAEKYITDNKELSRAISDNNWNIDEFMNKNLFTSTVGGSSSLGEIMYGGLGSWRNGGKVKDKVEATEEGKNGINNLSRATKYKLGTNKIKEDIEHDKSKYSESHGLISSGLHNVAADFREFGMRFNHLNDSVSFFNSNDSKKRGELAKNYLNEKRKNTGYTTTDGKKFNVTDIDRFKSTLRENGFSEKDIDKVNNENKEKWAKKLDKKLSKDANKEARQQRQFEVYALQNKEIGPEGNGIPSSGNGGSDGSGGDLGIEQVSQENNQKGPKGNGIPNSSNAGNGGSGDLRDTSGDLGIEQVSQENNQKGPKGNGILDSGNKDNGGHGGSDSGSGGSGSGSGNVDNSGSYGSAVDMLQFNSGIEGQGQGSVFNIADQIKNTFNSKSGSGHSTSGSINDYNSERKSDRSNGISNTGTQNNINVDVSSVSASDTFNNVAINTTQQSSLGINNQQDKQSQTIQNNTQSVEKNTQQTSQQVGVINEEVLQQNSLSKSSEFESSVAATKDAGIQQNSQQNGVIDEKASHQDNISEAWESDYGVYLDNTNDFANNIDNISSIKDDATIQLNSKENNISKESQQNNIVSEQKSQENQQTYLSEAWMSDNEAYIYNDYTPNNNINIEKEGNSNKNIQSNQNNSIVTETYNGVKTVSSSNTLNIQSNDADNSISSQSNMESSNNTSINLDTSINEIKQNIANSIQSNKELKTSQNTKQNTKDGEQVNITEDTNENDDSNVEDNNQYNDDNEEEVEVVEASSNDDSKTQARNENIQKTLQSQVGIIQEQALQQQNDEQNQEIQTDVIQENALQNHEHEENAEQLERNRILNSDRYKRFADELRERNNKLQSAGRIRNKYARSQSQSSARFKFDMFLQSNKYNRDEITKYTQIYEDEKKAKK